MGAFRFCKNVDSMLPIISPDGSGGGAIWGGFRSTITVVNSQFVENDGTAGMDERGGGAIAVKSESHLTVRDSQFTNNRGINGGRDIGCTVSFLTFLNGWGISPRCTSASRQTFSTTSIGLKSKLAPPLPRCQVWLISPWVVCCHQLR